MTDQVSVFQPKRKPVAFLGFSRGYHRYREFNEQFYLWFSKSRVVNHDGSPRVVYHGCANSFSAFSRDYAGSVSDTSDADCGFWFADSPGRAASAARDAAMTLHDDEAFFANIMPVFLRIERPKIFQGMMPSLERSAEQIAKAKSCGHDGVIWLKGEMNSYGLPGGTVYLVFEPNQIKSIFNRNPTKSENISE